MRLDVADGRHLTSTACPTTRQTPARTRKRSEVLKSTHMFLSSSLLLSCYSSIENIRVKYDPKAAGSGRSPNCVAEIYLAAVSKLSFFLMEAVKNFRQTGFS